ncbi:hypothetical protein LTR78_001493 [Recurvomyces mirabilis]|uniref:Uncharacterized protein n=1 Tax=Recurvomyces mirabilis TaxID=574656 RepID=A0AAE0WVT8_9PEZI|nr:hypothetical protein LTR78_001493 [Recurvomyces mirabilis]KAK5161472.1 hypothetical protein LTS14_001268 [Recurvomyces mirabilis]
MPTRNDIIIALALYLPILLALLFYLSSPANFLARTYGPTALAIYKQLKPYLIGSLQSSFVIMLAIGLYSVLDRMWWFWKRNELFEPHNALEIGIIYVYALAGMVAIFNRSVPNVGGSAPVRVLGWIWGVTEVWVFEPVGMCVLAVWQCCHVLVRTFVDRANPGKETSLKLDDTTPEKDNTAISAVLVDGGQEAEPELLDGSASPTDSRNSDNALETESNAWATIADDQSSHEADDKLKGAKGRSIASAVFITPGLKSPKPHDGGLVTPSPSPAGRAMVATAENPCPGWTAPENMGR